MWLVGQKPYPAYAVRLIHPRSPFFGEQSAVLWDLSVPRPGTKLMLPVLEAGSLNH